ncbi:hypothetical protein C8J56DRAFT_882013 [Mycena floridula]|nr:hypothetical protein C8J56DRAFT_882013 [Mycena floridula]
MAIHVVIAFIPSRVLGFLIRHIFDPLFAVIYQAKYLGTPPGHNGVQWFRKNIIALQPSKMKYIWMKISNIKGRNVLWPMSKLDLHEIEGLDLDSIEAFRAHHMDVVTVPSIITARRTKNDQMACHGHRLGERMAGSIPYPAFTWTLSLNDALMKLAISLKD